MEVIVLLVITFIVYCVSYTAVIHLLEALRSKFSGQASAETAQSEAD